MNRRLLPALVTLVVIACTLQPKITPARATQRFVTAASVPELLDEAARALESKDFTIVSSGEGYLCGERESRDFYDRYPHGETRSEPYWVLVRIGAAQEDDSTLVTIIPSFRFLEGRFRFKGEMRSLESEDARQSWCDTPRGLDTPLSQEEAELATELADVMKRLLG